ATAIIAAEVVVSRLQPAATEDVGGELCLHEALGILQRNSSFVFAGLVCVCQSVTCEGMRGFEAGRVKGVFGLKQVELSVDESFDLLLPMTFQLFRLCVPSFGLQVCDQIHDHAFVIESRSIG